MIVTDSKGRAIEVRRLTMVEQFDLASRIGQPNDSAVWWRMVCEVCAARSMDGALLHPPMGRPALNGLKKRLGPEGVRAVRAALNTEETEEIKPAKVEYQEPDECEIIDILEIGGTWADITPWRGVAFAAAGIRKIGDEEIEFPTTMDALRKLVERLNDPAVMLGLSANPGLAKIDDVVTGGDEEERAKN